MRELPRCGGGSIDGVMVQDGGREGDGFEGLLARNKDEDDTG